MADHKDWEKLDGKKIQIAWFINRIPDMQPYVDTRGGTRTLKMSAIYMGDRTELWIIEEEHGMEMARYNARAMESISWLNGDQ